MKSLIAGIVLIIVLGFAGFMYRNVMERTGGPEAVACTMEAKMCPDGSAVGRSGPDCAFAKCAYPNIELIDLHLSFALPLGYGVLENESNDATYLLGSVKTPAPGVAHYIVARRFTIPAGKSAEDVMLANSKYLTADMPAKSMSEFKPVLINGRTFQSFVADRFEGQITSYYYLVRETDVFRFDITESDVDWTNPDLVIENLPEHKALLKMLGTLQTQ